ncbi:hypothetical protein AAE478_010080 [Parahypoxylon ruwenzoriense]
MSRQLTRAILALASFSMPLAASPLYGNSSIQWRDCPPELAAPGAKVKCGYLPVPLDWDNPANGSINIGLARLPARKPESRIGNLFYQPGRPGNAGTEKIAHVESGSVKFGDKLRDHFDLIGTLSNPLKCDPDLYNRRLPAYPSTDAEFDARLERNAALRQSCIDMASIPLVDYMDSVSIATDHEAVRIALGDEPLSWFGVSYGTLLGS